MKNIFFYLQYTYSSQNVTELYPVKGLCQKKAYNAIFIAKSKTNRLFLMAFLCLPGAMGAYMTSEERI